MGAVLEADYHSFLKHRPPPSSESAEVVQTCISNRLSDDADAMGDYTV